MRPYVLPARTGLGERALRGRLGEARALAQRDTGRGLADTKRKSLNSTHAQEKTKAAWA